MAAHLRQGARRIGGSMLQRTQAAVAEERRRLVPRRMYSTEEKASGGIAREIQQRKDELYDLIAKGEKNAMTSSWRDAWLLTHLCEFFTPRPSECEWRDLKSSKGLIRGFKQAGFFSLSFLAMNYYISMNKKVAPAMLMEKEHEAREVQTGSLLMEN
uniref:Uncharacterized protein n=1 Tax=Avena sativa TaxID=4498 RepID=A0ACD5YNN2_AVESA